MRKPRRKPKPVEVAMEPLYMNKVPVRVDRNTYDETMAIMEMHINKLYNVVKGQKCIEQAHSIRMLAERIVHLSNDLSRDFNKE